MENLIEELKKLEELIIRCMKCGACQSVCPLYQKDLVEQSVARSKLALIESIYQGKIEEAERVLKYLDYCILCSRCKANCPSGVKFDEIILKAKSILRRIKKLPFWQKTLLKLVMEKQELLSNITPMVHIAFKYGANNVKDDIFRVLIKKYSNRHFISLKNTPFFITHKGLNKAKNEKMKVIFYPGCAVNFIITSIGEAILNLLTSNEISVYIPETNKCCGIPAATLGDLDLFMKLVNYHYDFFASLDAAYVITCCPTCEYALKDLGPRIIMRNASVEVLDILVFIDQILGLNLKRKLKGNVSLHMPCHYNTSYSTIPKSFIDKHFESTFLNLDNQECCGFGGTFNIKFYRDSKEISMSKVDEIKSKDIGILFTPCPGCIMQLKDATTTAGLDTIVCHPIEKLYQNQTNPLKGEYNG
mgnify:CR=1 FL=1